MTRQTTRRLAPSTSSHVGSQVRQVEKTRAPEMSMATPVRKMMRRMMTTDRQVEVMAALSSSSLFCLEISLEICFRRMEGLVLLGVIFSGKLIKIWRRQQISVCRRLCLYKSCPINKQRKGSRKIIGLNLFYFQKCLL